MGPMFAHIETHAERVSTLTSKKGRDTPAGRRKWAISEILAEAAREPGACPHVEAPSPPLLLRGGFAELRDAHTAMLDAQRQKSGRKVRADQRTLLSAVVSHPAMPADLDDAEVSRVVERWRSLNVTWWGEWARDHGGELHTVVEHRDESHVHLHLYVLPVACDAKANSLHPGEVAKTAAEKAARDAGQDPKAALKAGNRAYKAAMREWQDSYWEGVGAPSGLTRDGPRRVRLQRSEWMMTRRAVGAAATVQMSLEEASTQLDDMASSLHAAREEARRIREEAAARIEAAERAGRHAETLRRLCEQGAREARAELERDEERVRQREERARLQIEDNKRVRAELIQQRAILDRVAAELRQMRVRLEPGLERIRDALRKEGFIALWRAIVEAPEVRDARRAARSALPHLPPAHLDLTEDLAQPTIR